MKLCSRLFVLIVEVVQKTTDLGILIPILRKLGAAYNLGGWLVGMPVPYRRVKDRQTDRLTDGRTELL